MGIAIAAITLGVWFTYSALKGVSLADAFTGKGAAQRSGWKRAGRVHKHHRQSRHRHTTG
jgi:hypothetical protein